MAKKLFLAVLLTLGMAGLASADAIPTVIGTATSKAYHTVDVYNDYGSQINSGYIVAWDDDDTSFSSSEYRYATLAVTPDDPYTIGVMLENCAAGDVCPVVTYGVINVYCDDTTDPYAADTRVGVGSGANGRCGDCGTDADTKCLGVALENGSSGDNDLIKVFVDPMAP